jgi:hypothetical protein
MTLAAGWLSLAGASLARTSTAQSLRVESALPQAPERNVVRVPSARCSFVLPPGFEREHVQDAAVRARRPRQYLGQIAGQRARILVQLGEERFATVSRVLTAMQDDGPIDEVEARREQGEALAILRRRISGRATEMHIAACCPWRRSVLLAVVFEHEAGPMARDAARRVLDSFRLLPPDQITRSVIPDTQQSQEEITLGFPKKDQRLVRTSESRHYRLHATASGGKKLLQLLEQRLWPSMQQLMGPPPGPERVPKLPIFLHRTRSSYVLASLRNGIPRAHLASIEAHAWDRYFSSSYVSPRDPILLHEATHQYMTAVQGLDGGGAWLQEGLARWIEAQYARKRPERVARNLLQRDELPRLHKLVAAPSLFHIVVRGRKLSPDQAYDTAAALMSFLHDSSPDGLRSLALQAGILPEGDTRLIQNAFRRSLGKDLTAVESSWHRWLLERS